MNRKVIKIDKKDNYRIIAISDVHAHKDTLERLLSKIDLSDEDYLIIIGDFLNRGIDSFETYKFIRDMSKRDKTIILKGNHESFMQRYMTDKKNADEFLGFLKQEYYETLIGTLIERSNNKIQALTEGVQIHDCICDEAEEIVEYLSSLPILVHFDQFTFVHGGYDPDFDVEKDYVKFLKFDNYNELAKSNDRTVVVGHWPASELRTDKLTNLPFINEEKNIIFIDGGLGVKHTGELNAFIIEKRNGEVDYKLIQENDFERMSISKAYEFRNERPIYLNYPNHEFEVFELGEQMSKCKHHKSGMEFSIFSSLLTMRNGHYELKTNYVNKFFNLNVGEDVEVCHRFEDCVLVKHNDEFGWILKEQL